MNFIGDNLILIVGLVGFLLLMAVFGLLAGLFSRPKVKSETVDIAYQREDYPYEREDYLLSPSERTFYNALDKAVGADLHIFQKVRLIDIVRVRPGTPNPQGYKNRIDRKHIDFVVCEQGTYKPLVVVELDGASHQRARSQASDAVKDRVLEAAGLPILRVAVKGSYEPQELAQSIRNKLGGGRSPT